MTFHKYSLVLADILRNYAAMKVAYMIVDEAAKNKEQRKHDSKME